MRYTEMGIEAWIGIGAIVVILSLFFQNLDKKEQIANLYRNSEYEKKKLKGVFLLVAKLEFACLAFF